MEKLRYILYKFLLLMVFAPLSLFSQDLPDAPNPPRTVNDFASILSVAEVTLLENKLKTFSDTSSTQIAVITTTDLAGYDISEYAIQLGEKWGVGQDGKDNGVVIVVKPKTDDSKGEVFISVGYGLEGVLPDIVAGRIVNDIMIPSFQEGQIGVGIDQAVNVIMAITSGEYSADEIIGDDNTESIMVFVLLIIVIIIIISVTRGGSGDTISGQGTSDHGSVITPWFFGGGSSSSSSSGGGSFGGFGGGSFGGGGAGGSW